MTTPATASSLREATSPEALTRDRRRLLTAHPDPTRANTPTPGSHTDEQFRVLAAHDWAPPRIGALDTNTIATADPITRALLAESLRETLERRLAEERPHGTYDDTRAGHDAFSRGLVDDYDHGNHHLARATIRIADPGLVTCAGLSALGLPDADAPIIDELAGPRTPTRSRACSPTLLCSILTGMPLGEACVTRASEPPSCSRRQAGRVLVDAPGSLPATSLPKNSVTCIVLSGNVGLSAGARSWVMRSGVDVVCLSRRGSYQGALICANRGAHACRLLAQVALVGDRERRVRLAASLIGAKIRG